MKIYIVPHTHWDKEWYFIKDVSDIYLMDNFANIIDLNKINKDEAPFCYDGQFSIIDDFLKFYPDKKNEIKELIKRNKLKIGPWYTQTDTFNFLSESIVRNLLLGTKLSEEMGGYMNVAYLPDTFGFNSNLPQIISNTNNLGIINWRGAEEGLLKGELFNLWEAEDGSLCPTYNLFRHGYFTGVGGLLSQYHKNWASKDKVIDWNPETRSTELAKNYIDFLNKEIEILRPLTKSTGGRVLIPVGSDQMPMVKGWRDVVEAMNLIDDRNEYILSTFDEFMADLTSDKQVMANLKTIKGQFRYGKYARAHKTITSSRYDIKFLSRKAENLLYKELEPLSIIYSSLNGEYPSKVIIEVMKLLLSCHAHDSVGGCNTDETNRAIISRLESSIGLIEGQITLIKKRISESLDLSINDILLFNLEPRTYNKNFELDINTKSEFFTLEEKGKAIPFSVLDQVFYDNKNFEIIKIEDKQQIYKNEFSQKTEEFKNATNMLMDESVLGKFKTKIAFSTQISGLGYKIIKLKEIPNSVNFIKLSNENAIENEFYKITCHDNKINFFDKKNKISLENFLRFDAHIDAGDTYDYSPPFDHQNSVNILENITCKTLKSNKCETLKAQFNYGFESYNETIKNKNSLFYVDIILKDEIVDFKIRTENTLSDIRWTINFKTHTKNNKFTYADQSFAIVKRLTNDPLKKQSIDQKWADYPIEIEACESLVYVKGETPFAIFTTANNEYQCIEKDSCDELAITLFRGVSLIGKRDLLYRRGRASGINDYPHQTPESNLKKNLEFELAITTNVEEQCLNNKSKEYNTRSCYYQLQSINQFQWMGDTFVLSQRKIFNNNVSLGLLEIGNTEKLVCTSIKKKWNSNKNLIRFYNPTSKSISIQSNQIIGEMDLMDNELKKNLDLNIKPNQVKTFEFLVKNGSKESD